MEGGSEGEKTKPPEGEPKSKRKMKTASQLEILEKTYAVETYPSESLRAELSVQLGLSDRQLQMWFCHRRLKDRKPPPAKKQRKDAAAMVGPSSVAVASGSGGLVGDELMVTEFGNEHGSGSGSGSSPFGHMDPRRVAPRPVSVVPRIANDMPPALPRIAADMPAMKRYYEPPQAVTELRAIAFVEAQLGEPLREDGPILGMEFDSLPPDAFGAPLGANMGQQKQPARPYEAKHYDLPEVKPAKNAARALHEYQFLPEQPTVRTDGYERVAPPHYYTSPADGPSTRSPSLSTGRSFMHGNEQVPTPGYGFQNPVPSSLSLLSQTARQGHGVPSVSGEYNSATRKNSYTSVSGEAHLAAQPVIGPDNSFVSPDRLVVQNEDAPRVEKKRKQQSDEAKVVREVEAHEKRIRKELERQDILRRKKEEQMKKEMERHDRERRKEEERLLREKQREEERYQREQRREMERREKFLQKESIRAEKMRQKEELRREKEVARLKAANERATARRIAKESMELIEDERLELMEIATASKGLPSILALDCDTLLNLDLFRDLLTLFPPKSVPLKKPFAIQPWIDSEENIGNLFMVWRFLITFADVLGIWPFTLDEFVQAFHDYDPRLLGEVHVALLKTIIKDIEDVARTPSTGLGTNQNSAASPGGGHPHIVEGAYAWGFDIRTWQRHLNALTWPEILRQFALSAGFGPKLKKRNIGHTFFHDDNEGNDGEDVISNLLSGAAAESAVAIMQEKGFSNPRRSRHRLTPGTVKFAAFHVLSLEGSKGLTILEVAERIQRSGLRDLTTSKTPEASIAAALSRDGALFERTAPSTYCVRAPFRKDPVDAEALLSAARERIHIFKSGFLGGEEADDAERDEDSESDVAEDPETDDLVSDMTPSKDSFEPNRFQTKNSLGNGKGSPVSGVLGNAGVGPSKTAGGSSDGARDQEDTDIDESSPGEPWVQGLMEGEYSDLSIEERLNALVALIGVAIEGNSVRVVLEERLEAATALKKQMWAEAQLDKRRMKEEFVTRIQNPSFMGTNAEPTEGRKSPLFSVDDQNNVASINPSVKPEAYCDLQNDNMYYNNMGAQDACVGSDSLPLQPGQIAERSRSQFKAYIGHKAEEMYVYRSLPLGQDRRRNRYWQFITSSSRNDPGTGRIFVELQNSYWRLIDSEEGFSALLASLDPRGVRESHLQLMLQKIEVSFKESVRRNLQSTNTARPSVSTIKTEASDFGATTESLNTDTSDPSSTFVIELGRNRTEKKDALKRYRDCQDWLRKESFNSLVLCALKFGKKRCGQILRICDHCHDSYFYEDNHCSSCHKTYKNSDGNLKFSDHMAQCASKQKLDPDWAFHGPECYLPTRGRLLKALLSLIEASAPFEALQHFWSEDYRKSWGMKLHVSSSAEDLLQIVTLLESIVKKDWLSPNFETTNELLGSSNPPGFANNVSSVPVTVPILPWVPRTTAAVALRLLELDASISYILDQKLEFQKDKGIGDFINFPRYVAVKNHIQDFELADSPFATENLQEEKWVDPGSRPTILVGRGRGVRGRGRGRSRGGGRSQRRVIGLRSESDKLGPRVVGWKGGRPRGRGGRRRGRRTLKTRQKSETRVSDVVDDDRGSPEEEIVYRESPRSSGRMDWNGEEDAQNLQAESGDPTDSSSYDDDDNGQAIGDEYDDMAVDVYPGSYIGKSEELMDEDDEEEEGDEIDSGEDEQEDGDVERYLNEESDGEQNRDPEDGTGFESSSSDYSD